MISRLSMVAFAAAAFAMPAMANEAANTTQQPPSADVNLAWASDENDARQHLVHQGFINISPLAKDSVGRWSGTASKDGKVVIVAVDLRNAKASPATN